MNDWRPSAAPAAIRLRARVNALILRLRAGASITSGAWNVLAEGQALAIDPAVDAQLASVASEGQRAMFARYDTFRMNIYPTRRSAAFSQRQYDMARRNATLEIAALEFDASSFK